MKILILNILLTAFLVISCDPAQKIEIENSTDQTAKVKFFLTALILPHLMDLLLKILY